MDAGLYWLSLLSHTHQFWSLPVWSRRLSPAVPSVLWKGAALWYILRDREPQHSWLWELRVA